MIFLLVALAAVACGTEAGAPGAGRRGIDPAAYEGTWRLTSGKSPARPIPLVKGYDITLTISDGGMLGRSACNTYGGELTIRGSRIEFGEGGHTDMDCDDPVLESEEAYFDAFWDARSISLSRDGQRLSLAGDGIELVYEPVPPPPTKELVDTTWVLESLVEGRRAAATVTSAEPAELLVAGDGTFTGSTGCRRLTGEWSESGDEIDFHTMAADGNCPNDLRTQDSYVVGVLGDGFTAAIDGDLLTINDARGDLGLIYRAK